MALVWLIGAAAGSFLLLSGTANYFGLGPRGSCLFALAGLALLAYYLS